MSTADEIIHFKNIAKNKLTAPKHINGRLKPPILYRKEPKIGEITKPIPQAISKIPMTAAELFLYSIPAVEKAVV